MIPSSTREALKGLLVSKSFLFIMTTALAISMFSVTAIVIVGEGTKKAIMDTLRGFGFGTDSMVIFGTPGRLSGHRLTKKVSITFEDIKALKMLPWVKYVSPHQVERMFVVSRGRKETRTWLIGTTPDYEKASDLKFCEGRFFNWNETKHLERVCVLGYKVYRKLFPGGNAVGCHIRLGNIFFKVVGVMCKRGRIGRFDVDDRVMVPITVTRKILINSEYINSVKLVVRENFPMEEAVKEVKNLLRKTHRIKQGFPDDFSIITASYVISFVNRSVKELTRLLMKILFISLFLSGLVVTNVMMASVSERRREIGIKRAIGASRIDIFLEFIQSSLIVSLAGSLVGVMTGCIAGKFASRFMPIYINLKPFVLGIFFGTTVGALSGLYPAIKASLLNPVEVLRAW